MHVCTRARFKGGERDRAEQHRLVREWELQTERQRRVLERAETGSTRQHVCFYLTTLGSPRAQLSGCCCWRLVCSLGEGALERVVYTRVYQWLCMFNSTGFHSTTTRVRRFNQLWTWLNTHDPQPTLAYPLIKVRRSFILLTGCVWCCNQTRTTFLFLCSNTEFLIIKYCCTSFVNLE